MRNAAVGGTEADAGKGWKAGGEHGQDIPKERHLANSVWHLPIAKPFKVRPGDGGSKGTPQLSPTDGPWSIRGAPTWVTDLWPAGGDLWAPLAASTPPAAPRQHSGQGIGPGGLAADGAALRCCRPLHPLLPAGRAQRSSCRRPRPRRERQPAEGGWK